MGAFGLGRRAFLVDQISAGRLEAGARLGELGQQLLFASSDVHGLSLQRVGVRAGARGGLGVQVLRALTGDAHGRADPFRQRREPEPGLLGGVGALGQRRHRSFVGGQRLGGHRQPCGGLVVLAAQRGLGVVGALELAAAHDQIVGGQPQPRVAQVGLDGLRPAGHLGLAAKRLELAAQLGGQVGEPGQVGRHRLELADRLFLAFAVLEHAGGFLDEGAAVLRARLQDLRQPALADDDVHLPADAGVTQQLLDVHQTAAAAVDLVLAGAVAEHPPGDRDLGVLDGQSIVGVVDGQRHLGAPERRPRRGAGEDDVLHLAAAQRLGPLLAHHPGQRIDDVGLPRPVGADHAGDARFEAQSRR